jgi:CPA1 family monovalent cation:H+ antiporter
MAVCAGLLIGDVGAAKGMSEETRKYVDAFWKLIDEILNAVLFLLIGFEVFAIAFSGDLFLTGMATIIIALFARLAAVAVPITMLRPFRTFNEGVTQIMTWGGLTVGRLANRVGRAPDLM